MSLESITIGAVTTFGGLLAWLLAGIFDYVTQDQRYKREKSNVQTAVKHDPGYAATIGDIEIYLANLGAGPAKATEAALRNALQPLLVMAITAVASFRVLTLGGWTIQLAALGFAGIVFGLTALHEYKGKTDWQGSRAYWMTVIAAWVIETIMVFVLAYVSLDVPKQAPSNSGAPSGTAPGTSALVPSATGTPSATGS